MHNLHVANDLGLKLENKNGAKNKIQLFQKKSGSDLLLTGHEVMSPAHT